MKTTYSILTLLSISFVAAGPIPIKRDDALIQRTEHVAPPPEHVAAPPPAAGGEDPGKAAADKAGMFSMLNDR